LCFLDGGYFGWIGFDCSRGEGREKMRTRASLRKKGDELGAGASGDGVSDPELKELKKRKQRDRDQVLSVTETMKS